jgi:hypothetical protein
MVRLIGGWIPDRRVYFLRLVPVKLLFLWETWKASVASCKFWDNASTLSNFALLRQNIPVGVMCWCVSALKHLVWRLHMVITGHAATALKLSAFESESAFIPECPWEIASLLKKQKTICGHFVHFSVLDREMVMNAYKQCDEILGSALLGARNAFALWREIKYWHSISHAALTNRRCYSNSGIKLIAGEQHA